MGGRAWYDMAYKARLRPSATAGQPSLRQGLPSRSWRARKARLRPSGYDGAAFATIGLAQPKLADSQSPPSPFGLWRSSLRYDRACPAEAGGLTKPAFALRAMAGQPSLR